MNEERLICRYCKIVVNKRGETFANKAGLAQHEINWCPKNPDATLRKKT